MIEIKVQPPQINEVTITCPNCSAETKIDVEWGSSVALELAINPLCCYKCGSRLDQHAKSR